MALMDYIQTAVEKVIPHRPYKSNIKGPGILTPDDDMIVSKPAIVCHACQAFFNFLAMCCFASVASFQAKWKVGPSGLSGFAIFCSVSGIVYSLFLLLVPVVYEKYDRLTRLARALKEVRVSFILIGAGNAVSFLISFITTISAWTEAGCKNPDNDPHASLGDDFKNGLGGWCSTKKAGAIFFWLTFIAWLGSLTLLVIDWRRNKGLRPRDPPFVAPSEQEEGAIDDESTYEHVSPVRQSSVPTYPGTSSPGAYDPKSPFSDSNASKNQRPYSGVGSGTSYYSASAGSASVAAPRPSMDAYGAFSDPPPTGFGAASGLASAGSGSPGVSRTMQYADPYAAVRASIGMPSGGSSPSKSRPSSGGLPNYNYTGYQ